MSVHPTYKNLEAKLRVATLTVGQWIQLGASIGFAVIFVRYISPLPIEPTLSLAILLAGLPVAASYALSGAEFSATRLIVSVWRWRRRPKRYQPGPGEPIDGYVVELPPPVDVSDRDAASAPLADLELLWDD